MQSGILNSSSNSLLPTGSDLETYVKSLSPCLSLLFMDSAGPVPQSLDLVPQDPTISSDDQAPWYPIAQSTFISVEHPCIVKNVPKALKTLGDSAKLGKLVSSARSSEEASLCLRPDGMGRNVASCNLPSQNVLVRITVPRRTGRRRKKGSTDPFQFPEEDARGDPAPTPPMADGSGIPATSTKAKDLVRSLRDHPDAYTVHVLGTIAHIHRFRSLPDFVFSTKHSPFMQKVRKHILPLNYDAVKTFTLDPRQGARPDEDLVPPPTFTNVTIPFPYSYKQNPGVTRTVDAATGAATLVGPPRVPGILIQRIAYDAPSVPQAPAADLAPVASLSPAAQRLVTQVRARMAERPVWSRRALRNVLQARDWDQRGRRILQYAGYEFRSGPWRDLTVRFGVDPRTEPACRAYQSMVFQFDAEVRNMNVPSAVTEGKRRTKKLDDDPRRKATPRSHVFDGTRVGLDGKMWQVCDIEEPVVRGILATANLRKKCHLRSDGWYHNGTWAKAKLITKLKMNALLGGEGAGVSERDFAVLAALPDVIDKSYDGLAAMRGSQVSAKTGILATSIRSLASMSTPEPEGDSGTQDADSGGPAMAGRDDAERAEGAAVLGEGAGAGDGEDADGALDPRIERALREFTAVEDDLSGSEGFEVENSEAENSGVEGLEDEKSLDSDADSEQDASELGDDSADD